MRHTRLREKIPSHRLLKVQQTCNLRTETSSKRHRGTHTKMSTRVLRTRSQSGIRQPRKLETEPVDQSKERQGPQRKKKKALTLERPSTARTVVMLKKPIYRHNRDIVKREDNERQIPRSKTRQEVLEKLEICAKLITPTLQLVAPSLKDQVEALRKFKMFRSFDLDLGTINLLQSNVYEMDDNDKRLMEIMEMENGKEQQKAMFEHYKLKSTPGREEFNSFFIQRDDAIDDFSLDE